MVKGEETVSRFGVAVGMRTEAIAFKRVTGTMRMKDGACAHVTGAQLALSSVCQCRSYLPYMYFTLHSNESHTSSTELALIMRRKCSDRQWSHSVLSTIVINSTLRRD